jgi:hypothetical protein
VGTLATRYGLAVAYREAGRTAEAITLFGRVLVDRRRVLGEDHPDIRNSATSLRQAVGNRLGRGTT